MVANCYTFLYFGMQHSFKLDSPGNSIDAANVYVLA